jgi:thiol-disulfide isomerase/thioredoxin
MQWRRGSQRARVGCAIWHDLPADQEAAPAMTISAKSLVQRIRVSLTAAGLSAATWTAAAAQEPKNLVMHDAPKPIAAIQFQDGDHQSKGLADFRGKIVLLNVWATWCVPCREEMPALDRLQTALGGTDFEVVTLSIDRNIDLVRKFFTEVGITNLAMYLDSSGKALREMEVFGVPTTLLIDREGREIGRLIGPAEWDAPDMIELVRCVITKNGAPKSGGEMAQAATPLCGRVNLDLPNATNTNRQL